MVGGPPEAWTPERLGGLGKWLSGGTPNMANSDLWGGHIPWVSPKDMKRSRLWDAVDHVTDRALGNGTRLAPAHALLLVVRGMILAHTFPVARAELPLAFNQDIKALAPRDDVDSDFLLWWLTAYETELLSITTESTHGTKRMPTDALHAVEVLLPQLAEQKAIAAALNDVDALLGALDRLIIKKRDLKQAVMQQLLSGETRLAGFSGKWEAKPLRDICRSITDGTHYTPTYVENGVQFYSVENVTADNFTDTKFISPSEHRRLVARCKPERGDILLTRIGSIGATKLIDWDVEASIYVSLALLKVRPGISARYLYCYTKSRNFVRDLEDRSLLNAAPKKINMGEIGSVLVPLPDPAEQAALADVLGEMDAELTALEGRREKTRLLKQGMMQELLTGRMRLV